MAYLKFSADHLFTGYELLENDAVLITDEQGKVQEIVSLKDAGGEIQIFNGILTPGFVNCHCHLELSHMKGLIPEGAGLVDFVFKVVTERHFSNEEIFQAIIKAEDEMLQGGIVAVGDICNNILTIPQKNKRRLAYYNFVEASGWLESFAQSRFERSYNFYEDFQKISRDHSSIVPHAPYSVSNKLWELLQPGFTGKTITIHNQETAFEDELFLQASGDFIRMYQLMKIDSSNFKASGKSSLQTYFGKLKSAAAVLLVHNTFTKQEDIEYAKSNAQFNNEQLWWCLCANANLYIENMLPPVELFKNNNCSMVIGTDSLAGNRGLSIMDEIKTLQQHFPFLLIEELLKWATINGASALQMNDTFGSFEKGKQPGVVLIDGAANKSITAASTARRIL